MPATEKPHSVIIPPADTGLTAYLQILGGFLLMFNTWGLVLTYGTFQSYYETTPQPDTHHPPPFNADPSTTAWIGSIQAFLLLFLSGITGRLFDAGYLRALLLTGSAFIVVGLMLTSLVHTYWQALLAQGFCVGIGNGCLLVPSVGTASTWFIKKRGLAVGLVTGGSAVGGIVLPLIVQRLLPSVGFGWTLRILGFLAMATLSVSIAVLRQRLPPRKRGKWVEFGALKEGAFGFYAAGIGSAQLGFFVFLQFVQSVSAPFSLNVLTSPLTQHAQYAEAYQVSSTFAPTYYLPIINAASFFGRLFPTLLSDTLGPLNVQIPCALISAILAFAWLGISSLPSLLALCILYGFFSGGMLALPPAAVASLTEDLSHFGQRMGVVFMSMAVGSLLGTPIVGAILGERGAEGNWAGVRIWSGVVILLGAGLMGVGRWSFGKGKTGELGGGRVVKA